LVTEETKWEMNQILKEIQDGTYARNWIEENQNGRTWFDAQRRAQQEHLIEKVGARLRAMMPFIDPVEIKPGE
jgi:ketol-acid reductoisomerase